MKKLSIIILGFSFLAGCGYKTGSGNIVTEKRNSGVFTGLDVGGGFEVELRYGNTEEITVEADDNLLRDIETSVINGSLRIRVKSMSVHDAHLKVYVKAPRIIDIKSSGGAEVIVKEALKLAEPVHFQSSGGSNIETGIDAPEVFATTSSGAKIILNGKTRDLHIESSGGSSVEAGGLLSENSFVVASSGSDIQLHASILLEATASSGASVNYRGAANVKKTVSSGGEVEKDD